jgi:tetrapyrrole methylase family protein/MazG family protein
MSDLKAKVLDPKLAPFERLVVLMSILRSPEGCNWDRAQTHQTLIPYLIEEAYEVVDTIESDRFEDLREELGDLMVQIVFHAQLAAERGDFSINDAITDVVEKLVRRHPHVFDEKKDLLPQQVRVQWEQIKTRSGEKKSVLSGIPKSMPALTMAYRVGEKAGGAGFDWKDAADVIAKLEEELAEIRQAMTADPATRTEVLTEEIGDLLFAAASFARKAKVDPEQALKKSLQKFMDRFGKMETRLAEKNRRMEDHTLEELEDLWQSVKRESDGR